MAQGACRSPTGEETFRTGCIFSSSFEMSWIVIIDGFRHVRVKKTKNQIVCVSSFNLYFLFYSMRNLVVFHWVGRIENREKLFYITHCHKYTLLTANSTVSSMQSLTVNWDHEAITWELVVASEARCQNLYARRVYNRSVKKLDPGQLRAEWLLCHWDWCELSAVPRERKCVQFHLYRLASRWGSFHVQMTVARRQKVIITTSHFAELWRWDELICSVKKSPSRVRSVKRPWHNLLRIQGGEMHFFKPHYPRIISHQLKNLSDSSAERTCLTVTCLIHILQSQLNKWESFARN